MSKWSASLEKSVTTWSGKSAYVILFSVIFFWWVPEGAL